MPHFPTHPPFLYSLTKQHGDSVYGGGGSSAADAIALGSHVGTHIDALCHFSRGGQLHGGRELRQSYGGGLRDLSIDTVAPILRRGVLLDVAAYGGVEALREEDAVAPDSLREIAAAQGTPLTRGDVALIRTGWGRFWRDPGKFATACKGPGPAIEGARWLSSFAPFAVGSDTVSFEKMPSPAMDVHVHLLVECGIHIFECLNLEELSRDCVYEFLFIAAPLKIEGATGAPVRPLAISAWPPAPLTPPSGSVE
jgi:kynurenine formamidase